MGNKPRYRDWGGPTVLCRHCSDAENRAVIPRDDMAGHDEWHEAQKLWDDWQILRSQMLPYDQDSIDEANDAYQKLYTFVRSREGLDLAEWLES